MNFSLKSGLVSNPRAILEIEQSSYSLEAGMEPKTQEQTISFVEPKAIAKILVAVDPRNTNPQVFAQAIHLAQLHESELHICHCIHDLLPPASNVFAGGSLGMYGGSFSPELFEQSQSLIQEERQRINLWLQQFIHHAQAQGVNATFHHGEGDPGFYICKLAQDWQADLVVVGRRGRSGLSEMLMGSVSNHVVHHAPCAVLVVQ